MDFFLRCICCLTFWLLFDAVSVKGDGSLHRCKRETRHCKDKYKVLHTHSACKPRSSQYIKGGVSQADQAVILQEHNQYRGNVTPPATNMLKLSWDEEIADVAQAWAETCSFSHDDTANRNIPGRFSLGQNIGKGYTSWPDAIKAWWAEVKDFTHGGTNYFTKVGHYTQLVWAETHKLGCGMAMCRESPNSQYAFHVCNYAPAGNIGNISTPYETGTKCTKCQTCSNNICDCGEKYCENGGILHPGNCTCSCKYPTYQIGEQCKLDCSNVTEPSMCKSYGVKGCTDYPNVNPFECPNTCGVCPYGAYNYKDNKDDNGASTLALSAAVILLQVLVYWM